MRSVKDLCANNCNYSSCSFKEALFYRKLSGKNVKCMLCYRSCKISDGCTGFCAVRKNISGKLYSLVYGKPVTINIDPIEKKPIYHYLPKTKTLSIATTGCNFDCSFCQNSNISKATPLSISKCFVSPEDVVSMAIANDCPSISYTYTEPTVFVEYALDIMKLAKKLGLANIWVSNGYMQKQVSKKISKYLDAINIDLKGDKAFYEDLINGTDAERVKENIKLFLDLGVHVEVTNLLIERHNTRKNQIQEIVDFVASVDKSIPLHFSASWPHYKLRNIVPTRLTTLKLAEEIALRKGIKYVHLGNI